MAFEGTGGLNLGSAFGTISVAFSEQSIQNGLRKLDDTISGSLKSIGQKFQSVGTELTLGLAPVSAFVGKGVLSFMAFDDVLAEIEARTGATAAEMALVQKTALDMGQATAFSASEAAQAMLELLASGYSLDQALLALKPTLDAAAASGMGLGEAADTVTDILSMFQKPVEAAPLWLQNWAKELGVTDQMLRDWGNNIVETTPELEALAKAANMSVDDIYDLMITQEDAARTADILAAAAGASSAEMADLSESFRTGGSNAAMFGLSIEETAAAFAVMAENGIKGQRAGTALASFFNQLTGSPAAASALKELGVTLSDSQGNLKNFNQILLDLDAALSSRSEIERFQLIQDLAGSYGDVALSALLAADGVGGMITTMRQQESASVVAEKKMKSFKGVVDTLSSSAETFSILVLGPMVEKYMEPMIERVTEIINQWSEWAAKNPDMAAKLGLVLGVLAVLGPVLVGIGTFISLIGTAFAGFTALIGFLLSPLGLLIALFVALGVAYATNFLGFRDFVDNLLPLLKAGFEELVNIFNRLKTAFEEGGLSGLFEQLKTEVETIWPVIVSLLKTGFNTLVEAIKTYGPQILDALKSGLITIGTWAYDNILLPIWNELKDPANWQAVSSFLSDVLSFIGEAAVDFANWANEHLLTPLWNELTKQENWQKVGNFISDVLTFIASTVTDFAGWVNTHVLSPLWEQVSNPQNWIKVGNFIMDVLGFIASAAVDFLSWVNTHILSPIWDEFNKNENWFAVGEWIGSVLRFIAETVVDFPGWVKSNILDPVWKAVTDKENWIAIAQFLEDTINYIAENAPDWLAWVQDNIVDPMVDAIDILINQVGTAVVDGIKNGINDAWEGLTTWISEKAGSLVGGFMAGIDGHSPSRLFAAAAKSIPDGIALGISQNMQSAINALTGMTDQLGALAPTSMTPALAPAAAAGGAMNNFNLSGLTIQIPAGAIRPDGDPQQQGEDIAKGFWDYTRKMGGGLIGEH